MPLPNLSSFENIITQSILIKELITPRVEILKYKIELVNGSILYAKEVKIIPENKIEYAYQWQQRDSKLLIRWDNAHDYPNLDTSPFHKHVGDERNVLSSSPMTIDKVLTYINTHLATL